MPVLLPNGRPLAPCHPSRARGMVRTGKASYKRRYGIRCIVLAKTDVPKVKSSAGVDLRADPGGETTGIAVTRDGEDSSRAGLIGIELRHRGKVVRAGMVKRRAHRRGRRHRKTRYRKPRFSNRAKRRGGLPPSLRSRLDNTLTWMRRLSRLLPVKEIHVETAKFDPHLLRNPEISGAEYQRGPLYRTNLRTAVLERDRGRCVYCGRKGPRLELEHVVPRSKGGADRYGNLVASCRECNLAKGNRDLSEFLKDRPAKLLLVQAKLDGELAPATQMNAIVPELLRRLRADGWNVREHAAATTAAGRIMCGVEKSHHIDAAVTGCPERLARLPSGPIAVRATGRGQRQRALVDQSGTPRGRGWRQYCRMSRSERRKVPAPAHKKREKRVGGVATGDYVSFEHRGNAVHGYGTLSNGQVALTAPKWRSVKAERAQVVERGHGYRVEYPRHKAHL